MSLTRISTTQPVNSHHHQSIINLSSLHITPHIPQMPTPTNPSPLIHPNSQPHLFPSTHTSLKSPPFHLHNVNFTISEFLKLKGGEHISEEPLIQEMLLLRRDAAAASGKSTSTAGAAAAEYQGNNNNNSIPIPPTNILILTKNRYLLKGSILEATNLEKKQGTWYLLQWEEYLRIPSGSSGHKKGSSKVSNASAGATMPSGASVENHHTSSSTHNSTTSSSSTRLSNTKQALSHFFEKATSTARASHFGFGSGGGSSVVGNQIKYSAMVYQKRYQRAILLVNHIMYCVSVGDTLTSASARSSTSEENAFTLRKVLGLDSKKQLQNVQHIALNHQNEDELLCLLPQGHLKFLKILPQMPGEMLHNVVEVREELLIPYLYYQQPNKVEPVREMRMFNRFIALQFQSGYYIIVDSNTGKVLVNSLRHDNDKVQDFSPWPRLLEDGSGMFSHFCRIVGADSHIYHTDEQRTGPQWQRSSCCDYISPFVVNCEPRGIHFYLTYQDEVVFSKLDFKQCVDMCVLNNPDQLFVLGRTPIKNGKANQTTYSLLIADPLSSFEHKKRLIMHPRFLFKQALELHNNDFENRIEECIVQHQNTLEDIDSEHNKALTKLSLQREDGKITDDEYEKREKEIETQFSKRAKEEKQRNRENVDILERMRDCEERQCQAYAGLSLMKRKDFKRAFNRFKRAGTNIDARYFTPYLNVLKIASYELPQDAQEASFENPIYEKEILSKNVEIDSGYTHLFVEALLSFLYHTQLQYLNERDSILHDKIVDALFFSNALEQSLDGSPPEEVTELVTKRLDEEIAAIEKMIAVIEEKSEDIKPLEKKPDMDSLMQKVVSLQVENRILTDNMEQMQEQVSALRSENRLLHETIKKLVNRHSRSLSTTDLTSQITNDDTRSFHSEDARDDLLSTSEAFKLGRSDSDRFLRVPPTSPKKNTQMSSFDDDEDTVQNAASDITTISSTGHQETADEITSMENSVRGDGDADTATDHRNAMSDVPSEARNTSSMVDDASKSEQQEPTRTTDQDDDEDEDVLSEDPSITELLGGTASFEIENDSASEDTRGDLTVQTPIFSP